MTVGRSGSKILGHVEKGRPMFRLFFFSTGEEQLVHIDTGCTWEMVMEAHVADALRIARPSNTLAIGATLASGKRQLFEQRTTEILWFGARRLIAVHIPLEGEGVAAETRKKNMPPDGPCRYCASHWLAGAGGFREEAPRDQ